MFAFALCLVFNAHPDFWLAEAEFDKKHCPSADRIVRLTESYELFLSRFVTGKQFPPPNWMEFADAKLRSISEAHIDLTAERVTYRAYYLVNNQRHHRP